MQPRHPYYRSYFLSFVRVPNTFSTRFSLALLLAGSLLNMADTAEAQAPITVTSLTQNAGWISSQGRHDQGFNNYATGYSMSMNAFTNSWFSFIIPSQPFLNNRVFTSATLRIDAGSYGGQQNQSETVRFFDVNPGTTTAALDAPRSPGNAVGQALYADLGSGVTYGSVTVSAADASTILSIPLNAAALEVINNSRGQAFLIGGTLTSYSGFQFQSEVVFGNTSGSGTVRQLVLVASVAPEPSSFALTIPIFGMAAACLVRRRSVR